MKKFKNLTHALRMVAGSIIMLHGLLRIIFLSTYLEFVLTHFYDVIPSENALTIGASLLPFIEFFTGLLIVSNVNTKKAILAGLCISLLMSVLIVIENLYPRLIYHSIVVVMLGLIYLRIKKKQQTPRLSV